MKKRRGVETPTKALKHEPEFGSPSTATPASAPDLATILDIIFSSQEEDDSILDVDSRRSLRLTCKLTRDVVDYHVKSFKYDSSFNQIKGYLKEISPWRWPNIKRIILGNDRYALFKPLESGIVTLVTLPVPRLQSLSLTCDIALLPQLLRSNWPMLTHLRLSLSLVDRKEPVIYLSNPNIKFPKWPLEKLELINFSTHYVPFVGPLLADACSELTHYVIHPTNVNTNDMATCLASAPFKRLQSLHTGSWAGPKILEKLFDRDWPALKEICVDDIRKETLLLLASKSWLKNLERINIHITHFDDYFPSADDLRTFLKALQKSEVEELTVRSMHSSMHAEAFRGIQLPHLKSLCLNDISSDKSVLNDEFDEVIQDESVDISEFINVVFDSCCFPQLEKLYLSSNERGSAIDRQHERNDGIFILSHVASLIPRWLTPPTRQISNAFPLLKKFSLVAIDRSTSVAAYTRTCSCQVDLQYSEQIFQII